MSKPSGRNLRFTILSVGRLHPVKDHEFLVRACRQMADRGTDVTCWIAGEGSERKALEKLITQLELHGMVHLLGHLSPAQLDVCYRSADLVALTSRSEGIPVTLMEAMMSGTPVLAPAITGIPELIAHGATGFLYTQGSLKDFVGKVEKIRQLPEDAEAVARAGRRFVFEHFNRRTNLRSFGDRFLGELTSAEISSEQKAQTHANPILQQI